MANPERVEHQLGHICPDWDVSVFDCCVWAVHRETGVALYAPTPAAAEEATSALNLVLASVSAPRDSVEQGLLAQLGNDVP